MRSSLSIFLCMEISATHCPICSNQWGAILGGVEGRSIFEKRTPAHIQRMSSKGQKNGLRVKLCLIFHINTHGTTQSEYSVFRAGEIQNISASLLLACAV